MLELLQQPSRPGDHTTGGKTFFGQPRGLATLFFTEMWERFSYYGMRAFLILFMVAAVDGANPGLGFGEGMSGALYGLYTSMVYLLTLPGGWVADNLWGQRQAVFRGGVIIAMGHFTLAAPLIGAPDVPSSPSLVGGRGRPARSTSVGERSMSSTKASVRCPTAELPIFFGAGAGAAYPKFVVATFA